MKFKPVFSERYIRNACENEQCSMVMGAIEKVRLPALIDQQKCVADRPTDRIQRMTDLDSDHGTVTTKTKVRDLIDVNWLY